MSETLETYNPYATPEDPQYYRNAVRGAGLAVTNLLPGMIAQVLPAGKTAEGNVEARLPGLINAAYGGVGTLGPMATNYVAGKLGINTNLPALPGAEAALKAYSENSRLANAIIPHMEAQTPEEAPIQDMAFSAGGMMLPGGGLISGLPKVARVAAHIAVPTMDKFGIAPVAGAALTGAVGSYEESKYKALAASMGLDPDVEWKRAFYEDRNKPVPPDLSAPDTGAVVAHPPEAGQATNVPFHTASNQISTGDAAPVAGDMSAWGYPGVKVTAPEYGSAGTTGTPWWEVAGIGAAAVAVAPLVMRYGGKHFDTVARTITNTADQLDTAANATKFNARLDAIDKGGTLQFMGDQKGAVRGEAPLPGRAGSVMTNLAQSAYDDTRVLQEMNRATAPDRDAAATPIMKQMEADIGTSNSAATMHNKISEQMATGVFDTTGKTMPKFKSIVDRYGQLTDEQQVKLDKGLYAADEIDTRVMKTNTARNTPGASLADEDLRHNLWNTHSDDLRAAVKAMQDDPATNEIANSIWLMQRAHINNAMDVGRLTQNAGELILKTRPHQIPSTNIEGNVEHALGPRDITVRGTETPNTRAIDALSQHYVKLYDEFSRNTVTDKMMRQIEGWQQASPGRARIVEELLDNNGKPVADAGDAGRTITVYRKDGAHTYLVNNSNLWRAMKNNATQVNTFLTATNAMRRSYQAGTTGVSAAIIGQRPFGLINLNRNIMQLGTDRAAGTAFGRLDEALQRRGLPGYRGLEPTQVIGSYGEAMKGVAAVTRRNLADALRTPGNPVAKALRAAKGDTWVDAWARDLEQKWQQSNAGRRRAEGVVGAGTGGVYDRPTFNVNVANRAAYNPLAERAPGVFHPDGIQLPFTKINIPGTKGGVQTYINMRSWLRDIHQEISDGANSYYWKQMERNPNISQAQRVFETRRALGDPAATGSGKFAQWASHTMPWFNPSMQDAVRMMRNLRDNPAAFALGTMHTLGMLAVSSTLSAMLGGARHVEMLSRIMSTHERASNMVLFHDPSDPNNHTMFSLPQRWRVLYPMALEMVANGVGAFQFDAGSDMFNRIIHALTGMFSHNVEMSTRSAAIKGASDFADIFQVPPGVQAGLGAVGIEARPSMGQAVQNVLTGQPLTANMEHNVDQPNRLPGQAADSTYLSHNDSDWIHRLLSNMFGIAGDAYMKGHDFVKRFNVDHSLSYAMDGLMSDAGQTWRDNAPFGNMVWGNNVKQSANNPMEENNTIAWNAMKNMPKAADMQLAGLTRRGGAPISIQGGPKVSDDPVIRQMVTIIDTNFQRLSNTLQPRINDLNAQIRSINDDPYMNAQDKRSQSNIYTQRKNALEEQKSLEIKRLNAILSHIAGGKHVSVNSFDPARGREQFYD